MHWLDLQKHLEHTANLLDDLHRQKEGEYIRQVVIPRMHIDADVIMKNGKQKLSDLINGERLDERSFVQVLLDRDREFCQSKKMKGK